MSPVTITKTPLFVIFGLALILVSCETMPPEMAAKCSKPDNINIVKGGTICFGIRTYLSNERNETKATNPALLVFLHGDGSRGGPVDYMLSFAAMPPKGTVSVAMMRPGYYSSDGTRSSGYDNRRRDHYTARNVDSIAEAINVLRRKHTARKVVIVGHSGGAAIAGAIVGRHPTVAEAALLVSCPCDVDAWRNTRSGPWPNSLSPSSYVGGVAKTTAIIAITGENDSNTLPRFAVNYIGNLKSSGIKADFILIPGAGHGLYSLTDNNHYGEAIRKLISSGGK